MNAVVEAAIAGSDTDLSGAVQAIQQRVSELQAEARTTFAALAGSLHESGSLPASAKVQTDMLARVASPESLDEIATLFVAHRGRDDGMLDTPSIQKDLAEAVVALSGDDEDEALRRGMALYCRAKLNLEHALGMDAMKREYRLEPVRQLLVHGCISCVERIYAGAPGRQSMEIKPVLQTLGCLASPQELGDIWFTSRRKALGDDMSLAALARMFVAGLELDVIALAIVCDSVGGHGPDGAELLHRLYHDRLRAAFARNCTCDRLRFSRRPRTGWGRTLAQIVP
jgi:hypothetical protein